MRAWAAALGLAALCACACAAIGAPAAAAAPAKCTATKAHRCPAKKRLAKKPAARKAKKPAVKKPAKKKPPVPPAPAAPVDEPCMLATQPDLVGEGALTPGASLPSTGTLHVLVLFVDFPDDQATVSTQSVASTFVPQVEQYYAETSYGRLTVQMTIAPNWVRMANPSTAYPDGTEGGSVADPGAYMRDVVAAADPTTDFAPYDATIVVVPPNSAITRSEASLYPVGSSYGPVADGVRINFFAPLSSEVEQDPTVAWTIVAHELGHLLGLPDLYDTSTLDPVGEQTFVGSWDPMAYNWSGHEFLAWDRYKLGWLPKNDLACLAAHGSLEATIAPVEPWTDTTKALVVDLGDGRDVVAEARTHFGFDQALCNTGVLMYTVDQLGVSGEGPIVLGQEASSPTDDDTIWNCGFLTDAPFGAGQTYTDAASGVTIQVESANADGTYTLRATWP